MEKYQEVIAENPNVELIHISRDRSEDAAEKWASDNSFPWLTVLPDDAERSDLLEYRVTNSVPHYTLRDVDGNEIANGSSAVFAKIEELSSGN